MLMLTPIEWVELLDKRLTARCADIEVYNDYYEGRHPLVFATEKFRKAFGGMFDEFSDNWCAPVVNAVDERLTVVGFRFGDTPDADKDAWRIWQANHMDAESKLAIKASLIDAESALLVWPDPSDDETPRITVESADQMVVAFEPGSRYRRLAALKRWADEWTGETYASLYLPDGLYKFKRVRDDQSTIVLPWGVTVGSEWEPRHVPGETWPLPCPIGVVPVVPLDNDPRLRKPPRSELVSVIPLQNAINKLVTDMMVASEYGAFRQKWATGIEIPVDPVTNQPVEAFRVAVERFIHAPPTEVGEEPARFGEFSQTDLKNFEVGINLLVQHVSSHTRTPPHYLNASADRLSGESIKAAETGLVAKAKDKQNHLSERFEEVNRLVFRWLDDPRAEVVDSETIWADPETRTEAEHIDAVGKKVALLGIPQEQAWEDAGYSPKQITRMKAMLLADQLFADIEEEPVTEEEPVVV